MRGPARPWRGRLSVHLRYAYVGDAAKGARLFAPMRDAAPALIDTVEIMPYEAIGSIHNDPTEPMPAWDRGVLLRDLPEEAVDVLLGAAGPQADVPLVMVEIRHLGAGCSWVVRDLQKYRKGKDGSSCAEATPASHGLPLHAPVPHNVSQRSPTRYRRRCW